MNDILDLCIHKDIIEQAKLGDQLAMKQLYNLYSKAMLNSSYRILNDIQDAEDTLQDSFVKAFKSLDSFAYKSTFGAWLKRIVINNSLNKLKKRNVDFANEGNLMNLDDNKEAENYSQSDIEKIYIALQKLPEGYRTVFSLYMLEGYDHQEIAEILNIKVSTSISQFHRAKNKLRLLITNN